MALNPEKNSEETMQITQRHLKIYINNKTFEIGLNHESKRKLYFKKKKEIDT